MNSCAQDKNYSNVCKNVLASTCQNNKQVPLAGTTGYALR